MKRKTTFLKTLLVAAGLCVGVSAWAQTYTYEVLYGVENKTGVVTTSVSAQTDFTGDANATTLAEAWADPNGNDIANIPSLEGSVLCTNSSASWTKDFASPITEGKVYFSGVYVTPHNYKNGYPNAGDNYMLQIVDSKGHAIFKSATHCKNGSSSNVATICGTAVSNTVRLGSKAPHYVKSLCIDLDARTVTYDINVSSGSKSYSNKKGTIDFTEEITDVKGLYVIQSTDGYSGGYLDMATLYSVQSSNPTYTVNYKYNGTIVKTVNGRDEVGTVITASNIVYGSDDTKYFCTAETLPTMTLVAASESNVLDVTVRKAYQATLSVTTSVGGVAGAPVNTVLTEADDNSCNWSFAYSKYKKSGDYYYLCDAETYYQSGVFTDGQTIEKTISYNTIDKTIVAFAEAEGNNSGTNSEYSNGATGTVASNVYYCRGNSLGVFQPGYYTIEVNVASPDSHELNLRSIPSDANAGSYTNNSNCEDIVGITAETGTQTADFSLTEEKQLILNGKRTDNDRTILSLNYDYAIIRVRPVSATITSAGYATYCAANALDFSGVTGLTAYIATVEGETVSFSPVTSVPANTGVLLKGAAKTYEIPAIASSATNVSANKFVGVNENTVVNGAGIYVLMNGAQGVGFYQTTAESFTVGANTAYLPASIATAKSFIGFDDEAMGISDAVQLNSMENKAFFNLAGQRVAQPQKGLYIVDGKKVIIK